MLNCAKNLFHLDLNSYKTSGGKHYQTQFVITRFLKENLKFLKIWTDFTKQISINFTPFVIGIGAFGLYPNNSDTKQLTDHFLKFGLITKLVSINFTPFLHELEQFAWIPTKVIQSSSK